MLSGHISISVLVFFLLFSSGNCEEMDVAKNLQF